MIAKLRNRVQRRLVKLAKWSDCPAGVRMAEFNSYGAPRYTFVGQMRVRQMPYSKAIPPAPVPVGSVKMPQVYLRSGAAAVSNGEAVATNQTDTAATAAAGSSSGYRTSCRADEGDRNTIVAATHEATSAADRPGEAMEMSSRQDDMGSTNI